MNLTLIRWTFAASVALSLSACVVTPVDPEGNAPTTDVPVGETPVNGDGPIVEPATPTTNGVEVSPAMPLPTTTPRVNPNAPPPPLANPALTALVARATQFSQSGQWDLAAAELERGVRIAPQDGQIWLLLAEARLQQGQGPQAVELARRAETLVAPGSGLALRAQALIQKANGN